MQRKAHRPNFSRCACKVYGLFLVREVREIADIGVQQIECRFFLDGGQTFQPLADLVVGHMGCCADIITEQNICRNVQRIQNADKRRKARLFQSTLNCADKIRGKICFSASCSIVKP